MSNRAKELLRCFRDNEKNLSKENRALRKKIFTTSGEDDSSRKSNQEINSEIDSLQSNIEDNNMNEQLMKLKIEMECLKKQKKKLKQNANDQKRVKQIYKFLLVCSWCCFVVLYWICSM